MFLILIHTLLLYTYLCNCQIDTTELNVSGPFGANSMVKASVSDSDNVNNNESSSADENPSKEKSSEQKDGGDIGNVYTQIPSISKINNGALNISHSIEAKSTVQDPNSDSNFVNTNESLPVDAYQGKTKSITPNAVKETVNAETRLPKGLPTVSSTEFEKGLLNHSATTQSIRDDQDSGNDNPYTPKDDIGIEKTNITLPDDQSTENDDFTATAGAYHSSVSYNINEGQTNPPPTQGKVFVTPNITEKHNNKRNLTEFGRIYGDLLQKWLKEINTISLTDVKASYQKNRFFGKFKISRGFLAVHVKVTYLPDKTTIDNLTPLPEQVRENLLISFKYVIPKIVITYKYEQEFLTNIITGNFDVILNNQTVVVKMVVVQYDDEKRCYMEHLGFDITFNIRDYTIEFKVDGKGFVAEDASWSAQKALNSFFVKRLLPGRVKSAMLEKINEMRSTHKPGKDVHNRMLRILCPNI